jgi:hypothetical protein
MRVFTYLLVLSRQASLALTEPALAQTSSVQSCRMLVLVRHSTEPVASSYIKAGDLVRPHEGTGSGWSGRAFATP